MRDKYVWQPDDVIITKSQNLSEGRAITAAEKRADLSAVQKRLDALEQSFLDQITPVYDDIKEDAVKRLSKLIEAGDISVLSSFQLKSTTAYQRVLADSMLEAYNWSKKKAADEIKVASPSTTRDAKLFINQNAEAIAQKQFSDLLFGIKAIVVSDLRRRNLSEIDLSLADVLTAVSSFFGSFYDDKLTVTGPLILFQALNRAREDVFSTNQSDISRYVFSAVLDNRTTQLCRDLDGSVVDYAGWRGTKWKPPLHFNCRSIWVAVNKDQIEQPDLRPIPDTPGGLTEPPL